MSVPLLKIMRVLRVSRLSRKNLNDFNRAFTCSIKNLKHKNLSMNIVWGKHNLCGLWLPQTTNLSGPISLFSCWIIRVRRMDELNIFLVATCKPSIYHAHRISFKQRSPFFLFCVFVPSEVQNISRKLKPKLRQGFVQTTHLGWFASFLSIREVFSVCGH